MLDLFVESQLLSELPAWLAPFRDHLSFKEVDKVPESQGTLGLDRRGMVFYWQEGEAFRLETGFGQKSRDLYQALGSPKDGTVLDACAGFGDDTLGLLPAIQLTLVERSLPVALLLAERLSWMQVDGLNTSKRMLWGDALGVMDACEDEAWDIVYLDPMFPARNKGALPKRRMQVLSQLQSKTDMDARSLVAAARSVANKRVVLKRRSKDPVVEQPNFQIRGSKVRFDIYLP